MHIGNDIEHGNTLKVMGHENVKHQCTCVNTAV